MYFYSDFGSFIVKTTHVLRGKNLQKGKTEDQQDILISNWQNCGLPLHQ